MDFNQVVEFYEKISNTPKRLEMIDILSNLFIESKEKENLPDLPKIIYLTQGRLVSEIDDWPKFGIAEKLLIQAMVKYTTINEEKIKELINKEGDVGKAVEILLNQRKKQKIPYSLDTFASSSKKGSITLEISHLYSELKKLSAISGPGSQDLKINIMTGIFRLCNPSSAKYVVNIILSTLRIGIATKTIMDSLAQAYTGSKKNRSLIEQKYNIFPDLGKIALLLVSEGLEGLNSIHIEVGIPIKMMLASRIQYSQIQEKLGGEKFVVEYKYDGERIQIHKNGDRVKLFSRNLSEISSQYPDVVNLVRSKVRAKSAIFEGEVVAMDAFFEKMRPFQILSTRRRKYDVHQQTQAVPICVFCFDILYVEGWTDKVKNKDKLNTGSLIDTPFLTRRSNLEALFKPMEQLRFSNLKVANSTQEMIDFFNQARKDGAEGVMNKNLGKESFYQTGNRGFLWIKLKGLEGAKMADTIDVVIIGASWGKGRRKGVLSPFYGAVYNEENDKFEFLTRIGSGFTDEMLIQLTEELKDKEIAQAPKNVICSDTPDIWLNPKVIIEIMGDELTISPKADAGVTLLNQEGYGLRFPVFLRCRQDKDIRQITTTKEIIQLFKTQM